jgi:hypothetical protein
MYKKPSPPLPTHCCKEQAVAVEIQKHNLLKGWGRMDEFIFKVYE